MTIATGFADEATPDWALGDSHKHPSNLFLVLEVGARVGLHKPYPSQRHLSIGTLGARAGSRGRSR